MGIGEDAVASDVYASLDAAALLTAGQMTAVVLATTVLASLELNCRKDALAEEMRMCRAGRWLVGVSGVAHLIATINVNIALFQGRASTIETLAATLSAGERQGIDNTVMSRLTSIPVLCQITVPIEREEGKTQGT